jgi:hypothetical protein
VTKASRTFADDLEGVLLHYGGLCRVVQLWRQHETDRRAWTYLDRLPPEDCDMEVLKRRFGGGSYRAKLFGGWMRRERHEAYLEQVSFAIEGPPKPYPPGRRGGLGQRIAAGPTGST